MHFHWTVHIGVYFRISTRLSYVTSCHARVERESMNEWTCSFFMTWTGKKTDVFILRNFFSKYGMTWRVSRFVHFLRVTLEHFRLKWKNSVISRNLFRILTIQVSEQKWMITNLILCDLVQERPLLGDPTDRDYKIRINARRLGKT